MSNSFAGENVKCPYCDGYNIVDVTEESSECREERPMGEGILYESKKTITCETCKNKFKIHWMKSIYPLGTVEFEKIEIKKIISNNAAFGLSLQKKICDKYSLAINGWAKKQFEANYNSLYEKEISSIIPIIFDKVKTVPVRLLTYSNELAKNEKGVSPHNFLLKNGQTLSIRTTKTSGKVAPKVIGQAGIKTFNHFFKEMNGGIIVDQEDIKRFIINKIHLALPVFIDKLFESDITVFVPRDRVNDTFAVMGNEVAEYSFDRDDFSFTRNLENWKESTTLKYRGKSIAEIQVHRNRNFKFRFIISAIPEWFKQVKINNETLGISAESAVCKLFDLQEPESFEKRAIKSFIDETTPAIKEAFNSMPNPIKHTGSEVGSRGENSKCSYDFILEGNLTLSLKTNIGKKVCPPEVGQPGAKTCLYYFKRFFENNIEYVTGEIFKKMVFAHIDELIPIYIEHLFDSDWLLWIYKDKNRFLHLEISKNDIKKVRWDKKLFSFTKKTVQEWNESNTVKYNNITIGEFQVHKNRNCYKFRFDMPNLIEIVFNKK